VGRAHPATLDKEASGAGLCGRRYHRGLTRSELIADLAASNPHLRAADVERIVETIFDRISAALARGQQVQLRRFGTFTVKRRKARIGRNPSTGVPVSVAAKGQPYFRTSQELLKRLNHWT
jgi:integration host factor subunit beta